MDNIGGLNTVFIAFVRDIRQMTENTNGMQVLLAESRKWYSIPSGRYKVTINVVPQSTASGLLYDISATILIPRQSIDRDVESLCTNLARLGSIMRYKDFNDNEFVVGSKKFPLSSQFEFKQSAEPSGFSGFQLEFKGKQLTGQQAYIPI